MKPRISFPFKPQLYTSFSGLNTSRSDVSLERPEAQPFSEMDNLYCSSNGYLSNESPIVQVGADRAYISHFRFMNAGGATGVYAARIAGGTSLRAYGSPYNAEKVWPKDATVTSTMFNGVALLAGGQDAMYSFDGTEFKTITSESIKKGRYVAQVQNRVVVAGFDTNPNEIVLSRVNKETIYPSDEGPNEASVLRAARFNVQNLLGNGDRIRGIASFEANKLAIFTGDRMLAYIADPDFTLWTLDTRLVVRYGTLSHKSIVNVGDELYFCSRAGVHSLRRSGLNGNTVFTMPMTQDIQELYQKLVAMVSDEEDISAYFHPEDGRLHIFFPVNSLISYRLSATLTPAMGEDQVTKVRWALTTFAGTTCGDNLAGRTIYGSISGLWQSNAWYSDNGTRGEGYAMTPILWHKDLFNEKQAKQLVVYASGVGRITVQAWDETGRQLSTHLFDLPDVDQAAYFGVPLQRQFTSKFEHQYVGVKLKVSIKSDKMIRVFGLGVLTLSKE
jgi:hypothetical protein